MSIFFKEVELGNFTLSESLSETGLVFHEKDSDELNDISQHCL